MQKLLLKKKKKQEVELSAKQRVALHAVQKQLQVLNLKEWLVVLGFIGGAALLRVPMQAWPNVEPLTFFAVLSGWLFGKKKGFITGASSLYISNFLVLGGQGPWTIFQVLGFGLAGFFGGFLKDKSKVWQVAIVVGIATLVNQAILNLGWSMLMGFNVLMIFITGSYFAIVSVVSNVGFSFLLPAARKLVYERGGFNEREVCMDIVRRITAKYHRLRTKS